MRIALGTLAMTFVAVAWHYPLPAWPDDPRAAILIYHHVATDTPRSTSVTPEVFANHLEFLRESGYQVIALERIIQAMTDSSPLPAKSVALTFDDAYASVHSEVLPHMQRLGWPYTVFVATDAIDQNQRHTMSWEQLREIEKSGGRIANHSRSHAHLVSRSPGETRTAWEQRVRTDILDAQARLEAELTRPLRVFAYPYGEFDADVEAIVKDIGFTAVGQQSGPVGPSTSLLRIPRFPVATGFDDVASLGEKLDSIALPVSIVRPRSSVVPADLERPQLDLRITRGRFDLNRLNCFVSGQANAQLTWLDKQTGTVRIQARAPITAGRTKYTCTAPSLDRPGIYYWYSHLWMKPRADGSWYDG